MQLLSIFSVLVPLILGLILFNKLDINSRWLMLLLAITVIPHMAALTLARQDIYIYYNTFSIIDALFWGVLFYKNSYAKKVRLSIIVLLCIQVITFIVLLNSIGIRERFFSEFVCLNSLIQLLLVLSFFYERYDREQILALETKPMFWFCVGILIYGPTTYFHFAFYDLITSGPGLDDAKLERIHHFMNICMYLIFSIGLYSNVKRRTIYNVFN